MYLIVLTYSILKKIYTINRKNFGNFRNLSWRKFLNMILNCAYNQREDNTIQIQYPFK